MFNKLKSQRGTSLVEMIVTLTIFATVATLAITGLSNTLKGTKHIQAQVFVYTEAQTIMDQLARYVERHTVDYEAYFARNVLGEPVWETGDYGTYGMRFFDPGTGGPETGPYGFDGYGIFCNDGFSTWPDDCASELPDYDQGDTDDGTHPFGDIAGIDSTYSEDPRSMNAFCESTSADTDDCEMLKYAVTDELILINSSGDERFVFARELAAEDDYRMAMLEMWGTDNDSDGIPESWNCSTDYDCSDLEMDLENGPDDKEQGFMPLTPDTINIEEFYVVVAPVEDPYKAFGEEDAQIQPHVTLVMTVGLSESYGSNLLSTTPSITIQRTISTGVYSEVESYE